MPYYWEAFCSFKTGWEDTWTDFMICPPEKQAAAADYYTSRRHIAGFDELLDFTPCSLWPLIRLPISTAFPPTHDLQALRDRASYPAVGRVKCVLNACKIRQQPDASQASSSTALRPPLHEGSYES